MFSSCVRTLHTRTFRELIPWCCAFCDSMEALQIGAIGREKFVNCMTSMCEAALKISRFVSWRIEIGNLEIRDGEIVRARDTT